MTSKREEIREGVEHILNEAYRARPDIDGGNIYQVFVEEKTPDQILEYLDSMGVAIKVEKELPDDITKIEIDGKAVPYKTLKCVTISVQTDMLKAGFTAWERLVE